MMSTIEDWFTYVSPTISWKGSGPIRIPLPEPIVGEGVESFMEFIPNIQMASVGSFGVDWKETHAEHVIKVDLPGLQKNQVKVDIEDGSFLRISGERKPDLVEETGTWHFKERSTGKFDRKLNIPKNTKIQEIKAAMKDGVLTVTVPKEVIPENKPVVTSIDISG